MSSLVTPLPRGYHWSVLLSHRAILFALTPPTEVKLPPTYTSLPLTTIASTARFVARFTPPLREYQWPPVLSQRAMLLALTPPAAVENKPPTYISLPLMAIVRTQPSTPLSVSLPRGYH